MKLEFHINITAAEMLDLIGRRDHLPRRDPRPGANGESKTGMIRTMLLRSAGVTSKEAQTALGWKMVNVPHHARKGGIEIYRREKENGHTRYFGRRTGG